MHQPTVLMTGGSGFIGTHLIKALLAADYKVIGLSRKAGRISKSPHLTWVQQLDQIPHDRIDYVINLAGESIGKGRWTETRKQQLLESRVKTTEALYQYLRKRKIFPKCIISGSAVGYYGIDIEEQWTKVCDENTAPQAIFMSELCQSWEQVTRQFPEQNTIITRLGVVLAEGGGILPQMLRPIQFNLVNKIGSGRQPFVWIHIQDVIRSMLFLMKQAEKKYGLLEPTPIDPHIFNLVAPEKTTQAQFAQIAARQLAKKPWLNVPAIVFKILLGEQSQLILNGQLVQPAALLQQGFEFKFPTLKEALQDLLA